MKKTARILKIGLTIFLFGLLPLVVLTLITSKTGVLMGIRSFTVLSGSMEPTLPVGSMIYTLKQPTYELGDVVSVAQDDVTVTHRIYQTTQKDGQVSYLLKGDANNAPDEKFINAAQVQGRQFLMVPFVGYASAFVRTPAGFGLLIVFPAVLVIGFELYTIKKELEVQVEKRVRNELGASA